MATSVTAILRTSHLYVEHPNVSVAYQLRDQHGNVRVKTTDLVVSLRVEVPALQNASNVSIFRFGCGLPAHAGIGQCSGVLDHSLFSSNRLAQVFIDVDTRQAGGAVFTSRTSADVILHGQPRWWSLDALQILAANVAMDCMYATLPSSPKYAGEQFIMHVHARATSSALISWGFTIHIDPTVLAFVSGTGATAFNSAIVHVNPAGTTVRAVAVGLKPTTSYSEVSASERCHPRTLLALQSAV